MKKTFFISAFALLALVACEQKQSELDLNAADVKVATVTGQVTYNPGGENAKTIPADSVEVRAIVPNNEYSAGATGLLQVAPVRTNKDGFFQITIPVGQATINNVQVEVVPFQGEYTDPNTGVKQTVFYTSEALPAIGLSLNAGDVKNVDILMQPELTLKDYTSSVKISGIVTYNAGIQKVTAGYEVANKPYANRVLKVKGTYTVGGAPQDRDFKDITTDENGAYSFEVPAGSTGASVTITTVRFDGQYTEEVNGEYKTIDVYYNVAQHVINFTADDVEKRNEDFTINAFDRSVDLSKNYVIKRLTGIVKTYGEAEDEESKAYEAFQRYKWVEVFMPFSTKIKLTCPDYDAANPTSALVGNELIFTVTPSTKDGKVELNNIKVYSAWEGYDIRAQILVDDLKQSMKHTYFTFGAFRKTAYAAKTWAEWHKDETDLSTDLSNAFWALWPSESQTEQVEGYYTQSVAPVEDISKTELKYYGEHTFSTDAVVRFVPRDKSKIHGIYSGIRNEEGEAAMEIADDVVDAADVPLKTSVNGDWYLPYSVKQQILSHDKYQGVCINNWEAL